MDYFKTSKCTLNFTENYIFNTLHDDNILAICRALEIICKVITQPYWKEAVNENRNALQMEPIFQLLIQILETAYENPPFLLQNTLQLLPGPTLPLDPVTEILFKPSFSLDAATESFLKRFCIKLMEKSKSLFKDFLPSGKFFEPSDNLMESTKSCPSNNISVERVFGQLDAELKRAPHCSLRTVESKLLYKNNKTAEWLKEKGEIINEAVRNNSKFINFSKLKQKKLHENRLKIIEERKRLKQKERKKKG
ncbi:unnamed protein product [Mytilus edulis]|uniref:Uncharacterized protein n=1 Tax=Mytilus edulis TaxID=6550 RepID=A0A8S3TR69_MYTED|nr:unnamed protein product [Mytilus edulis]